MPISKECLELLRKFANEYEATGKKDHDYKTLYDGLKTLLEKITRNSQIFKDELVTGCLASTALHLVESNPQFFEGCKKFQTAYQSASHTLNSFYNDNFDLQSGPEWAQNQAEDNSSRSRTESHPTAFLLELQMAIRAREQRMLDKKLKMTCASPSENASFSL